MAGIMAHTAIAAYGVRSFEFPVVMVMWFVALFLFVLASNGE
jgi:hypothetical protein